MPFPGARSLVPVALTSLASLVYAQKPELPLKHAPQPTTPAISAADLMTRLYIFADDSMMGREVGTPYHLKATAYIEREARRIGLVPGGDNGTFFQNIPVFDHPLAAGNTLAVDGKTFSARADYVPRDNSVFGKVRSLDGAEAVYGGIYGDTNTMVKPSAAEGKVVVMSVPNGPDGKPVWGGNRQQLTGYYLGAAGVAVVSLDAVDQATRAQLLEPAQTFKDDDSDAPSVPAFLYVTQAMGEALMGAPLAGISRGAMGRTIHGSLKWDDVPAPGRNVVAILPGSDAKLKGQYVALGAHNDHVGFNSEPVDHDSLRAFNTIVRPQGEDDQPRPATAEENAKIRVILDSLRKIHKPRLDSIYNGADDDGTGSMALLEIAEAFAKGADKPKRSLVFVWHAGEEKGLWGSRVLHRSSHCSARFDRRAAQHGHDRSRRGARREGRWPRLRAAHRLAAIVDRVGRPGGSGRQNGADEVSLRLPV